MSDAARRWDARAVPFPTGPFAPGALRFRPSPAHDAGHDPDTADDAGHDPDAAVAALIRTVAATVVMPRFRNLVRGEISEKSPGEVVTVADREAEEQLAAGLALIDPQARVVGEEACSADPSLMADLGRGALWIVDPIDGTSNFAEGRAPFGIMIARAVDGIVETAWLYDPLRGRMCHAVRGGGAFVDGVPLLARRHLRRRPVAALATQFMGEAERRALRGRAGRLLDLVPIPRCAAEHYPRVALGENDIALFQRTLPWDHAAGALFLTEAGGRVARWDGADYRIDDDRAGLLVASTRALWDVAAEALFGGAARAPHCSFPQPAAVRG